MRKHKEGFIKREQTELIILAGLKINESLQYYHLQCEMVNI